MQYISSKLGGAASRGQSPRRCPAANQKWAASVHAPRKMADRDQEGPGETGEDTDELLYSDVEAEVRGSGPAHARPPRDHCDLLLDAIDAQLSRLQAQSHVVRAREDGGNSKRMTHNSTVLGQSQSVSKDTGFGSTLHTNATSTPPLDVGQSVSETPDLSSEKQSGSRGPDSAEQEEEEEEEEEDDGGAAVGEAEEDSERERCLWRLERLLGRAEGGFGSSPPRREDSVRTEDFAARFREEMLEPLGGVRAEGAGPGSGSSREEPLGGVRAEEAGPGGGAPLGLGEQSTQAQHSQLPPAGGDSEQSGDTASEQVELSQGQSPQGCKKCSVHQESRPIGGRSVSMTALTDSTPLCVHKRPGTAPTSDGTNWTSTPHAEGPGGGTTASLKPKSDALAQKVSGSGTRMMSRCPSWPGPTPEPTERELQLRVPSPGWTPVSRRSPLRDTETPLCPPPPVPYGPPCPGPAPPDCIDGGLPEVLGLAGFGSAPGPPSSSGTGVLTASRSSVITAETEGVTGPPARPAVRHLAGVPVKSFDSVTIDSDLDSVRTDRVREHFRKALRCGAAVRCAQGNLYLEDLCTDQSDPDLLLEPRSKFSLQALRRNVPDGSRRVRAPHNPRRGPPSAVVRYDCSDDEETDEEEEAEEAEPEHTGLSGLDHRGLVQKNSAPWRRRPGRLRRPHLRTLTGGWLEAMSVDRLLLEEALHALRQNCLREEERLKQKREQLHDTELSLTTLLQQKKHAVQELEYAQERAEQAEREGRGLEASLRDSRTLADSTRSQLRVLQAQRDAHAQELRDLEAELTALRRHKGAESEKRLLTSGLSVLEREELDRQLDSAKTELFAERRRARHKLDSLQERLEETQQELEQCVEEVRVLRASHTGLEEELTAAQRQREDLEQEEGGGAGPRGTGAGAAGPAGGARGPGRGSGTPPGPAGGAAAGGAGAAGGPAGGEEEPGGAAALPKGGAPRRAEGDAGAGEETQGAGVGAAEVGAELCGAAGDSAGFGTGGGGETRGPSGAGPVPRSAFRRPAGPRSAEGGRAEEADGRPGATGGGGEDAGGGASEGGAGDGAPGPGPGAQEVGGAERGGAPGSAGGTGGAGPAGGGAGERGGGEREEELPGTAEQDRGASDAHAGAGERGPAAAEGACGCSGCAARRSEGRAAGRAAAAAQTAGAGGAEGGVPAAAGRAGGPGGGPGPAGGARPEKGAESGGRGRVEGGAAAEGLGHRDGGGVPALAGAAGTLWSHWGRCSAPT
ncbi:uncharacterized protein si:ch211-102c2.8 isoform X3 [Anguilla rostrata]|uniref:uncharacterized protein si:ch211-102c2.8 isoform X3 n=1 Tax=Anguilla rostrata TaxID=7938 RepID=UPI0030D03DF8